MALPDFLIIGAMKCGTSTLQAQLAAQPGVFMTTPKEPNFFSDDDVYAQGMDWYKNLYSGAAPNDLKGEASTHYTKLPTFPNCLDRLRAAVAAPKLIYMIRNPIARTVSHYIHEWSMGQLSGDIEEVFEAHPELVAYSQYAMQIAPYVQAFGANNVLLISLDHMQENPQAELARVGNFLGLQNPMVWQQEQDRMNASAERIKRFPLYGLLVDNPVAATLRRTLVPQALRDAVKVSLQMRDRPELSEARVRQLEGIFTDDYAELKRMFPDQPHLDASYPFAVT